MAYEPLQPRVLVVPASPASTTPAPPANAAPPVAMSRVGHDIARVTDGAPLQRTKKRGQIEYAESDDDARKWLSAQGFDLVNMLRDELESAIGIARDPERGVSDARDYLNAPAAAARIAEAKAARVLKAKDDYSDWRGGFGDDLANDVFETMYTAYVGGGNDNPTVAGTYTEDQVEEATTAFKAFVKSGEDLTDGIKNVHWFGPQNKAALGKGNVGATLDKREVQANFIANWYGRKINAHVNVVEGD